MKRILLSLSVAALVSVAGVSLAQDYGNTAPNSPNTGSPTSPDNSGAPSNTMQTGSPSLTSPNDPSAPGITSGTVVLIQKGQGWTAADDSSTAPLDVVINGQKTQISLQQQGQLNIMPGTSPQDLRIEIASQGGSKMERCAKVEVMGNKGKSQASTGSVSQIALTISKKDDRFVCDKATVTSGSTGNGYGM